MGGAGVQDSIQVLRDAGVERVQQGRGGGEVVVEGAARDAGGGDEFLDRRALEAPLGDHGLGGVQQPLAGPCAALLSGGGAGLEVDPHGAALAHFSWSRWPLTMAATSSP